MSNKTIEIAVINQFISNGNIGIAIVSWDKLTTTFENEMFTSWFPAKTKTDLIVDRICKVNLERLKKKLGQNKPYSIECEIKENKRSKILKLQFTGSPLTEFIITVTDYSKEKEKDYLLDSYAKMAEKNRKALEKSLEIIKAQKEELLITNAALERERNNIELRALQAVINPHFVSNCLSSIQGFIVDKNTEEAVNYLADFGRLMRLSFEQSYNDYVSIEEIITLLNTYVSIEKMRMDNPWDLIIEIDEDLNVGNATIPPLLIQPFLENSIWHGINKIKGGKILLKLDLIDDITLKCTIEDNGVGRKHKEKQPITEKKKQPLHSLNVTNKRLDILWKEHKKKYKIIYTDLLTKTNAPTGTRVELYIPINF